MFLLDPPQPIEAWSLLYVAYILWLAGITTFVLILTHMRSPSGNTSDGIKPHDLIEAGLIIKGITAWSLACFLGAIYVWPALIYTPLAIIQIGAPLTTLILTYSLLALSMYGNARLFQERFLPHSIA